MKKQQWLAVLCGSLGMVTAGAQTMIHDFEYAFDDELFAYWTHSGNAVVSVSDTVAAQSTGSKSMRVDFSFPTIEWATETVTGPGLDPLLSILPEQYLTFRLRGDPAFAAADFRELYLYCWDEDGNFGRWGSAVPITDQWTVQNYLASTIAQPWNSPGLPDLNRIVYFAFYQYGSQAALEPYTASIYIDDLQVRDTPLVEFGPPSAPRSLIDDFEGYANDGALMAAYKYEVSPPAVVTTATLDSPAPQGSKALKLAINFAAGQWPWGSVRSSLVEPFSFPTNAVMTLRFKGDAILEPIADGGTSFWVSFYDKGGKRMNFSTSAPVSSGEWVTLEAPYSAFWGDLTTIDSGNLVQWRILVEGWEGTAESSEMSGAFYIDDIRIGVPSAAVPSLAIARTGDTLTFAMGNLSAGAAYELKTSSDLVQWTTAATITADSDTATWTAKADQPAAFFRLVQP
jgi:hypothetical protein